MGLNTMRYAEPWTQHPLREGDTQLRAGSTALSLSSLPSGKGRDEQSKWTLRLWWSVSLKLREAGPTRGGRKHLDRLLGEGAPSVSVER